MSVQESNRGLGSSSSTSGGDVPGAPGKVQQAVSGAKEQVGQVADELSSRAAPVMDQAQEKAEQAFDQARQQATTHLGGQKDRAVDGLDGVVHAVRQTSQNLREQGQGSAAGYVDQAAQQVERLAGYLRTHEVGELVDETEQFARRQPQLFLVGSLALGLMVARFFKSSARQGPRLPNGGAATVRPGAYGANFATGTDSMGSGGQYVPGAMSRPPTYAGVAPGTSAPYSSPTTGDTPSVSGPYSPSSTSSPSVAERPGADVGLEPGRRV